MTFRNHSPATGAIEEIARLQSQIDLLKENAVIELKAHKSAIEAELRAIAAEIEALTGEAESKRGRPSGVSGPKRLVTLLELKDLLAAAPDRTLNIRRQKLDFLNVKTLVHGNASVLRLGGKAPWPTVTLLK